MGIAGFVLGMVSIFFCWIPILGGISAVLGMIFSGIGMRNADQFGAPHKGLSIAGLATAIVGLLLSVILFFVFLDAFSNEY